MSYFGKVACKITYSSKNNYFKGLSDVKGNIDDFVAELDEQLDFCALADAEKLANELAQNYELFLDSSHISSKVANANVVVAKVKNGWKVDMYGKDILYHEFGTGQRGKSSKYPRDILNFYNWDYIVGSQIIQNFRYVNGDNSSNGGKIPNWYIGMVTKGKISSKDYIWMSPYGPSRGLYAGMFWYDTISDYTEDLKNPNNVTRELGKRTLMLRCKNKLTKGKWK